jgi:choline kinase
MIRAIILAAGRGSRLHPYTEKAPKCLTEFGGVSLIERQITTLRAAGIKNIVIATGYLAEMLERPDTRRVHNPDWADTNMVETLFAANNEFGDDMLVCYADIVYEKRLIDSLLASPAEISVAINTDWRPLWEVRFSDPLEDAESLKIAKDGRILEIGEPAQNIDEIEGQFTGLMRFRGMGISILRRAYESIHTVRRPWQMHRSARKAYMTDLLMEIILSGERVMAVPNKGGWLEIDTVRDFELVRSMAENSTLGRFYRENAIGEQA